MNFVSAGKPHITVENNVDLTGPPENFTYINNYLPAEGIEIPDDPPSKFYF
jgi:histone-lysine N-methyltransferase SUV39H